MIHQQPNERAGYFWLPVNQIDCRLPFISLRTRIYELHDSYKIQNRSVSAVHSVYPGALYQFSFYVYLMYYQIISTVLFISNRLERSRSKSRPKHFYVMFHWITIGSPATDSVNGCLQLFTTATPPPPPAAAATTSTTLLYFTFSFRLYPSASRKDSNVCRLPDEWLVEATSREPQQCQPWSHSISFSVFLLLSSQSVWCYRSWELVALETFLLDVRTTLLAVVLYAVGLMLLLPWLVYLHF